jgi:hypothetical protein
MGHALISLAFYPGIVLMVVLAILHIGVTEGAGKARASIKAILTPRAWISIEGFLIGVSLLLTCISSAFLPYPLSPAGSEDPGLWVLAWGCLEMAFLLSLVPGLLAGWPPTVRATIREAQIGVVGRALLWVALFGGLSIHTNWAIFDHQYHSPLLAHLLFLLTAFFAFPVAVGWGSFAPEQSVIPGGMLQGLDRPTAHFFQAVRAFRAAALLAASLVSLLPLTLINPFVAFALFLTFFLITSILLRSQTGATPRLALPGALQLCWWRVLLPGVAALIYLWIAV